MKNVRVWFIKTKSAKYVSHLDLLRCMTRVLKISKLPVWHTEGYNPRIYMTFAMPLSLGFSGEREIMDIRLNEDVPFDKICDVLRVILPEDIYVTKASEPIMKLEEICFANYQIDIESKDSGKIRAKIDDMLNRENLTVIKHGKKGNKEVDIKPHFSDMKIEQINENLLRILVCLPCSVSGGINPNLFINLLETEISEEISVEVIRKCMLDKSFAVFQ